MTYFQAISELCCHIDSEYCIKTILDVALDEHMLDFAERDTILQAVGMTDVQD